MIIFRWICKKHIEAFGIILGFFGRSGSFVLEAFVAQTVLTMKKHIADPEQSLL